MKRKILVVDDESDILNLAKMILEKDGFQVITASDGVEGEIMAKLEKPDLILLDIVMPEKNGLEVCQTLKSRSDTKHIPIIIFSASGSRERRDVAIEAGADDFLQKPFTMMGLTELVKKHLSRDRLMSMNSKSEGRLEQLD